ncbi:MAG: hypothetical protein MUP45_04515 [Candidatus Marinimicrobia bacterium]|nr:hypothetical protein [Candidatus Neomarinimicrobiota bacterium]
MRTRKVLLMLGFLAFSAIVITTINTPSLANSEELQVFEEGNLTYIPVHQKGTPEENFGDISANFTLWEMAHPDREIVSFQIDSRFRILYYGSYVESILIYSREK